MKLKPYEIGYSVIPIISILYLSSIGIPYFVEMIVPKVSVGQSYAGLALYVFIILALLINLFNLILFCYLKWNKSNRYLRVIVIIGVLFPIITYFTPAFLELIFRINL